MSRLDEIMKRTENFRYDRFGMFIHWEYIQFLPEENG